MTDKKCDCGGLDWAHICLFCIVVLDYFHRAQYAVDFIRKVAQ